MTDGVQPSTGAVRPARRRREVTAAPTALTADDVHYSYERAGETIHALQGASITIRKGEFVAIVGRSGSGKSTLLHVLGGLAPPTHGAVTIGTDDLASLSSRESATLRRQRLTYVFQFFHLLGHLTVTENVALPLVLDGVAVKDATRRADAALARVGLTERRRHHPDELSGGQLQRAAVARALVVEPEIVLADEPTGNLDSTTAADVLDLLASEAQARGAAVVLVTHDADAASRAHRTLVLADGRLE